MQEQATGNKRTAKEQLNLPSYTTKKRRDDPSAAAAKTTESEIPLQERRHVPVKVGAQAAGLSPAALYRAANEGKLKFVLLAGRTLVDVPSLIAFIATAEPWKSSTRGAAGRAAKAENAIQRWR